MATPPINLLKAKHAVMRDVTYVQKSCRIDDRAGGYSFASESDVIRALRPAMVKHGITFAPVSVTMLNDPNRYMCRDEDESKNYIARGPSRVLIQVRYRFTHAESGEYEDVEVLGESGDSFDKAAGKAQTYAEKVALRQYFLLETGEDPDYQVALRDDPEANEFQQRMSRVRSKEELDKVADEIRKRFEEEKEPQDSKRRKGLLDAYNTRASELQQAKLSQRY